MIFTVLSTCISPSLLFNWFLLFFFFDLFFTFFLSFFLDLFFAFSLLFLELYMVFIFLLFDNIIIYDDELINIHMCIILSNLILWFILDILLFELLILIKLILLFNLILMFEVFFLFDSTLTLTFCIILLILLSFISFNLNSATSNLTSN